jgi:hypothetical protein
MDASDVKTVSSFLSWMSESASEMKSGFKLLANMADSSEGMALCVTSGNHAEEYASFVMRGEKFDALVDAMNEPGGGYRLDELAGGTFARHDGVDAWELKIVSGDMSTDLCYVARRKISEANVIMVASNEDSIEEMNDALDDPSGRFAPAMYTDGENHVLMKFGEPANINIGSGGPLPGVLEASWTRDERGIGVRTYSDMYKRAALSLAGREAAAPGAPILGEGTVSFYASLDPAFVIYSVFPRESDPIKFAVSRTAPSLPAQISAELEKILGNCRLSSVVVQQELTPSVAYLVLQTPEDDALQKLVNSITPLFAPAADIEGWDAVYAVPSALGLNASLAVRNGTVLLGVGDIREHSKKNAFPDDTPDISSPGALTFFLSSGLFSMKSSPADKTIGEMLADTLSAREIPNFLLSAAETVERVTLSLEPTGRGSMDILLKRSITGSME